MYNFSEETKVILDKLYKDNHAISNFDKIKVLNSLVGETSTYIPNGDEEIIKEDLESLEAEFLMTQKGTELFIKNINDML